MRVSIRDVARLLLLALILGWSWAASPAGAVDHLPRYLVPDLDLLEDPGGAMTLEEVLQPEAQARFKNLGAKPLSLGLRGSVYWVRIHMPTARWHDAFGRPAARFLELGKAIIDQVDLYLPVDGPDPGWRHVAAGVSRPLPPGQVHFRTPVLITPPNLSKDRPAYLRLKSSISLSMTIRIWSGLTFMAHAFQDSLAMGLIFGCLAAMMLFNLMIFVALRERAFVAYVFYVLSMLMAQLTLQGYVGSALRLPQPHLPHLQAFCMAGSMFFAALFTRVFLLSRQNAPFWDKLLNIFLYAPVVMAALVLLGRLDLANPLGYVTAALGPLHAVCTARACQRRGFRPARFFLVAWTVLIISVFTFELVSLGHLPFGPWSAYILPLGTALESILLTLALSDRIKLLHRERQELARNQRRFQELSVTDGLTGLYNLRFLKSKLTSEMEHARRLEQPLSLIMLDLDDFKAYNDTFGHVEGDRLLLGVARVLKRAVREGDVACRYGGEEFTVLLPGTELEAAMQVAERVRRGVERLAMSPRDEREARVTVSLGVANLQPGDDDSGFIQRADQALYQAKAQGKNCCVKAPGGVPATGHKRVG